MKLAKEMVAELLPSSQADTVFKARFESIIAAKLEPVKRALRNTLLCCRDLADQQAMLDDFWEAAVEEAESALALFEEE